MSTVLYCILFCFILGKLTFTQKRSYSISGIAIENILLFFCCSVDSIFHLGFTVVSLLQLVKFNHTCNMSLKHVQMFNDGKS